jgi:hypothetical protein
MKNLVFFLLILALVAAAYISGRLPEHRRLVESQQELRANEVQLTAAQARLRLYALQSRLAGTIQAVRDNNYGNAAKLSSEFFDGVRAETNQPRDPQAKSTLEAVLATRDAVTAKLAKSDPTVVDALNSAMSQLRQLVESSPAPGETGTKTPVPSPTR